MTFSSAKTSALLLCLGVAAPAAMGRSYAFDSGSAPHTDQVYYPYQLQGVTSPQGTTFDAGDITFWNRSGNPAFFNGNNLLTRASSLISGGAFWTDPRLAPYPDDNGHDIANLGFQFDQSFGDSLGFDLVIATAGNEIFSPTNNDPGVRFTVTDSLGNVGHGDLYFKILDDPTFDLDEASDAFFASLAGTFHTLNSPRLSYEARFDLPADRLFTMLDEQNGGGGGDDDVNVNAMAFGAVADRYITSLEFRFQPLASLGGPTQAAIDNVVINGAARRNTPLNLPVFLPPTGPFGNNIIHYIYYADEDDPNAPDNATRFSLSDLGDRAYTSATVTSDATPVGAEAFSDGSTIYFKTAPTGTELVAHEVTHTLQSAPSNLPPGQTDLGSQVTVSNITADGTRGAAPSPQVIETTVTVSTDPLALHIRLAAEQQSQNQIQAITSQILTEVEQMHRSNFQIRLETQTTLESGLFAFGDAPGPEPLFYFNYTAQQYLVLKGELDELLVVGDQGSYVTPVFDDAGEIITYAVSTWIVTDASGTFQTVFIPEPASAALLAVGLLLLRRRRA